MATIVGVETYTFHTLLRLAQTAGCPLNLVKRVAGYMTQRIEEVFFQVTLAALETAGIERKWLSPHKLVKSTGFERFGFSSDESAVAFERKLPSGLGQPSPNVDSGAEWTVSGLVSSDPDRLFVDGMEVDEQPILKAVKESARANKKYASRAGLWLEKGLDIADRVLPRNPSAYIGVGEATIPQIFSAFFGDDFTTYRGLIHNISRVITVDASIKAKGLFAISKAALLLMVSETFTELDWQRTVAVFDTLPKDKIDLYYSLSSMIAFFKSVKAGVSGKYERTCNSKLAAGRKDRRFVIGRDVRGSVIQNSCWTGRGVALVKLTEDRFVLMTIKDIDRIIFSLRCLSIVAVHHATLSLDEAAGENPDDKVVETLVCKAIKIIGHEQHYKDAAHALQTAFEVYVARAAGASNSRNAEFAQKELTNSYSYWPDVMKLPDLIGQLAPENAQDFGRALKWAPCTDVDIFLATSGRASDVTQPNAPSHSDGTLLTKEEILEKEKEFERAFKMMMARAVSKYYASKQGSIHSDAADLEIDLADDNINVRLEFRKGHGKIKDTIDGKPIPDPVRRDLTSYMQTGRLPATLKDWYMDYWDDEGIIEYQPRPADDPDYYKDTAVTEDSVDDAFRRLNELSANEDRKRASAARNKLGCKLKNINCPKRSSALRMASRIKHIKMSFKFEPHKRRKKVRGFYILAASAQYVASEKEENFDKVLKHWIGSAVGADPSILVNTLGKLSRRSEKDGFCRTINCADIQSWSPKMSLWFQRLMTQNKHRAFTKPNLYTERYDLMTKKILFVNSQGYVLAMYNPEANLEGIDPKTMTGAHGVMNQIAINRFRQSAPHRSSTAMMPLYYIDDTAQGADIPRWRLANGNVIARRLSNGNIGPTEAGKNLPRENWYATVMRLEKRYRAEKSEFSKTITETYLNYAHKESDGKCTISDEDDGLYCQFLNEIYQTERRLSYGLRAACHAASLPIPEIFTLAETVALVESSFVAAGKCGVTPFRGTILEILLIMMAITGQISSIHIPLHKAQATEIAVFLTAPQSRGGLQIAGPIATGGNFQKVKEAEGIARLKDWIETFPEADERNKLAMSLLKMPLKPKPIGELLGNVHKISPAQEIIREAPRSVRKKVLSDIIIPFCENSALRRQLKEYLKKSDENLAGLESSLLDPGKDHTYFNLTVLKGALGIDVGSSEVGRYVSASRLLNFISPRLTRNIISKNRMQAAWHFLDFLKFIRSI